MGLVCVTTLLMLLVWESSEPAAAVADPPPAVDAAGGQPAGEPRTATAEASAPAGEAEPVLAFRIAPRADALDPNTLARYREALGADEADPNRPADYLWAPLAEGEAEAYDHLITAERDGRTYLLVSDRPGETMVAGEGAWGLDSTYVTRDVSGRAAVGVRFDPAGAERLAALTGGHRGEALAVVVEGQVVIAPTVQSTIAREAVISGDFEADEARRLARRLRQALGD